MAEKGFDIIFQVLDGVTYRTLGGLRERSVTINNEQVDVTSASTLGYRRLLEGGGTRSVDIAASGVFEDDAASVLLQDKLFANTHATLRFLFENGDELAGSFAVATGEMSGTYNDGRLHSFSFQSAGAYTFLRDQS